jgi:4-amino-4-deoxy-L-arabinose transferase-like glycosyltransferase
MKKIFKKEYLILSLILILSLALRLYKINLPIADRHSWRQADTAAVARNFIKEGFDFKNPKVDNMAPVSEEITPNPERLFYVEPPIYQTIIYPFYKIFGIDEKIARGVSISFSLLAIIFLFSLVDKITENKKIALLSAFFMGILPFSVYYSRVVMPEPEMLFFSTAMLYFFYSWIEKDNFKNFFLAVLFTSISLTIKAFPFFLSLPMFYLLFRKYSFGFIKQKKVWFFIVLSLIPFIAWRFWISNHPEAIPSNNWLFNLNNIRFRPAFFRWIFAERLAKLILGYWGLVILCFGLIFKPFKKEGWFFIFWLLSFLAFVTVFASGNITHDYYQVAAIPIISFFLAKGTYFLIFSASKNLNKFLKIIVFLVCFCFMIGFSWFEIKGYYLIQGGVDIAGEAVDRLTPKNSLILTGDTADTTLLYNTNRHGWAGGYASHLPNEKQILDKAIEMGAEFYVTTKVGELNQNDFGKYLYNTYNVLEEKDQYVLFDLRKNK